MSNFNEEITIKNKTESAVDSFTPPGAAAVVQRDPSGATERIADKIVHSHVSEETTSILDIRSFAPRRICAGDIVMVSRNAHGT